MPVDLLNPFIIVKSVASVASSSIGFKTQHQAHCREIVSSKKIINTRKQSKITANHTSNTEHQSLASIPMAV